MRNTKTLYTNFVESSRIILPKKVSSSSSLCKTFIQTLSNAKTKFITQKLKLIECYSLNKFPSINLISTTSEILLIYDHYIEEINRIFNFFYDNYISLNNISLEKFIYGLCAEENIINNNKKGFIYSSINYKSRLFSFSEISHNDFLEEIQTYFLLFHEYSHFIFLNKIPNKLINNDMNDMSDLVSEVIDKIYDGIQDVIDNENTLILNNLKSDKHFIEECWCDVCALKFILEQMEKTINTYEKLLLAVKAIFYEFTTLKLLLLTKDVLAENVQKLEMQTLIRMSILRNILRVYNIDPKDLEKIDKTMYDIEHGFCDTYCEFLFAVQDEIKNITACKEFNFNYNKLTDWYCGLFL